MSIAESAAIPAALTRWLPLFESGGAGRSPLEVIETTHSWILLADRHAYKIKKAVDLGEARFHTPARRHKACVEEIRLNRRLGVDVYLGVVPLARDATGELRLNSQGDVVEWAIKMRRLPHDRNLLCMMEHDDLSENQVEALAAALANFYFGSPPVTEVLDIFSKRLQIRIDDITKGMKARLPANMWRTVQRITSAQHEYLDGARMVLNFRVCDGRVVDGHGDLRPENIFLERQPVIIGCVEYSATLRRSDALDDLCALTMECRRRERAEVAEALITAYRSRTGDECFPHLEAFYRSLHACARAKTAIAAPDKLGARPTRRQLAEVASYLQQAEQDAQEFVD